jgi:hypothetical protein
MFLGVAPAAQSADWNPRFPLSVPSSIHSLIQIDNTYQSAFLRELPECLAGIREHLKNGGNFQSQAVLSYSTPIEEFPRNDVKKNKFYHWTNAETALDQIAKQKSYGDLFSYARTNSSAEDLITRWYFYIAADAESSRQYGDHGYRFSFYEGTRVYFVTGDKPGNRVRPDDLLQQIANELGARSPKLKKCVEGDLGSGQLILRELALEASNVSLIAYFGIGNFKSDESYGSQWLQVINPWAIKSMEAIK